MPVLLGLIFLGVILAGVAIFTNLWAAVLLVIGMVLLEEGWESRARHRYAWKIGLTATVLGIALAVGLGVLESRRDDVVIAEAPRAPPPSTGMVENLADPHRLSPLVSRDSCRESFAAYEESPTEENLQATTHACTEATWSETHHEYPVFFDSLERICARADGDAVACVSPESLPSPR